MTAWRLGIPGKGNEVGEDTVVERQCVGRRQAVSFGVQWETRLERETSVKSGRAWNARLRPSNFIQKVWNWHWASLPWCFKNRELRDFCWCFRGVLGHCSSPATQLLRLPADNKPLWRSPLVTWPMSLPNPRHRCCPPGPLLTQVGPGCWLRSVCGRRDWEFVH